MGASTQRPGGLRRLAAVAALGLVAAVVVATLVRVASEPLRVLVELLLLVLFLAAAWFALPGQGSRRAIAVVVATPTVVALTAVVVGASGYAWASLLVRIVGLGVAVELSNYALGATVGALEQSKTTGRPVRPPFMACCS